jgi:hypothetical protein
MAVQPPTEVGSCGAGTPLDASGCRQKNKTAEGDTLANRAGDGFSWAPYLHVMLATCPTNQFSLYTQMI